MPESNTRERILSAAQNLFAKQGFSITTLRQITDKADVNLAAVNYHFGSKEQLLLAVAGRSIDRINKQRMVMLDCAEQNANGAALEIKEIARCFLIPAINDLFEDDEMPCILSQAHNDQNTLLQEFIAERVKEVAQRFIVAIQKSLPHISLEVILARGEFMVGALLHTLQSHNKFSAKLAPNQPNLQERSFITEQLVTFCTAGLSHE